MEEENLDEELEIDDDDDLWDIEDEILIDNPKLANLDEEEYNM